MTEVFLPEDLDELWRCLSETPDAFVFAGGTDLLVKRRAGLVDRRRRLVGLERIPALRGVRETGDEIWIGATTTHESIAADCRIQGRLPVLVKAIDVLGSPAIRAMGTLGGNICTASPAGDTLGPLHALDAQLELVNSARTRRLALRDFIAGPGRTHLEPGEILAGVCVRVPRDIQVWHFEKVGLRNALACSLVNLTALLGLSADGLVTRASLAWGSVGPCIVSSDAVERCLIGRPITLEVLKEAASLARTAVSPISDVRADAAYRRAVAGNLLYRLLDTASQSR